MPQQDWSYVGDPISSNDWSSVGDPIEVKGEKLPNTRGIISAARTLGSYVGKKVIQPLLDKEAKLIGGDDKPTISPFEGMSIGELSSRYGLDNPEVADYLSKKGGAVSRATDQRNFAKENPTINDIGVRAREGVAKVPGVLTGLADIPLMLSTGTRPFDTAADAIGKRTGFQPKEYAKEQTTLLSDEEKQAQTEKAAVWEDERKNLIDVIGVYAKHPNSTVGDIVASLPQMALGGVFSQGLRVANVGLKSLAGNPLLRGAAGEGMTMAGSSSDEIDRNKDNQRAALAAIATGITGAAISFGSGKLAQRLGVADIEEVMASGQILRQAGSKSLPFYKSIPLAMVQEGVIEEGTQSAFEAALKNWAEDKPLMQGVNRAVFEGIVTGSAMGGGINAAQSIGNAISPQQSQSQPQPAPQPEVTKEEILAAPTIDDAVQKFDDAVQKFTKSTNEPAGIINTAAYTETIPSVADLLSDQPLAQPDIQMEAPNGAINVPVDGRLDNGRAEVIGNQPTGSDAAGILGDGGITEPNAASSGSTVTPMADAGQNQPIADARNQTITGEQVIEQATEQPERKTPAMATGVPAPVAGISESIKKEAKAEEAVAPIAGSESVNTSQEAQGTVQKAVQSATLPATNVYHGTSKVNAESIRAKGYMAGGGIGMSSTPNDTFVFTSPDKASATFYAKDNFRNKEGTEVLSAQVRGGIFELNGRMPDYVAFGAIRDALGLPTDSKGTYDEKAIKKALVDNGYAGFSFRDSNAGGRKVIAVLPESLNNAPQQSPATPIPAAPASAPQRDVSTPTVDRANAAVILGRTVQVEERAPGMVDKVRHALKTGEGNPADFTKAAKAFEGNNEPIRAALLGIAAQVKKAAKPPRPAPFSEERYKAAEQRALRELSDDDMRALDASIEDTGHTLKDMITAYENAIAKKQSEVQNAGTQGIDGRTDTGAAAEDNPQAGDEVGIKADTEAQGEVTETPPITPSVKNALSRDAHPSTLESASDRHEPLNADAVEDQGKGWGLDLPDGYIKKGDRYVYEAPSTSTPEAGNVKPADFAAIDAETDTATREDMLQFVASRAKEDAQLSGILDRLSDPAKVEPYVGNTSRIAHAVLKNNGASSSTKRRAQEIYDVATRGVTTAAPLESRHAALDPRIDALNDLDAVAVGKAMGIEYKRGEDIREKIKQSHPDDQEKALAAAKNEAASSGTPEAESKVSLPAPERKYHLVAINDKTGTKTRLTSTPATHSEAMTIKSKQSNRPDVRYMVEEVRDAAAPQSKELNKVSQKFWKGETFAEIAPKVVASRDVYTKKEPKFTGSTLGVEPTEFDYYLTDGRASQKISKDVYDHIESLKSAKPSQSPKAEPASTEGGKIEDFGGTIAGNRKDRWKARGMNVSDMADMAAGEQAVYATKDNVWPKLDYAAMIESGVEPKAAALIKIIRDRMSAKPRNDTEQGRNDYVEAVAMVRDAIKDVRTEQQANDLSANISAQIGLPKGRIDRNEHKSLLEKLWSIYKSRSNPLDVHYADNRKVRDMLAEGWPAKKETVARTSEDTKTEPSRPYLDKLERTGADVRNGKNVTTEDFANTFGMPKVNFGNYVANDEGQRHVNLAFEALYDLANVMGVPPKAMSLNGTLNMAFGARGTKFPAHYEPGEIVINIGKVNGPGSLAHEFAHALDHYFGEIDRPDAYGGKARGVSGWYDKVKVNRENLRPEMANAFDGLMKALYSRNKEKAEVVRELEIDVENRQSDVARAEKNLARDNLRDAERKEWKAWGDGAKLRLITAQAKLAKLVNEPDTQGKYGRAESSYYANAQKLSGKSAKSGYWSRPTEMFARSFESFIFDQIQADSRVSDYLVHGVEADRFAGEEYKGNPYPVGEERNAINAAFENLVKTLKTKETDKGVALYQSSADYITGDQVRRLENYHDTSRADAEEMYNEGYRVDPETGDYFKLSRPDEVQFHQPQQPYSLDSTGKKAYGETSKGVNYEQQNAETAGRSSGQPYKTVAGLPAKQGFAELTKIRSRDKRGPLVVFRGSQAGLVPEHFRPEALGYASGKAPSGRGVHFTDSREHASEHGNVEEYHLDIRNPYVYKTDAENAPNLETKEEYIAWAKRLAAQGHDGIVEIGKHLGGWNVIIPFSPEQVVYPQSTAFEQKQEQYRETDSQNQKSFDFYAEHNTRPGTTDGQKRLGESAIRDILGSYADRAGISVLGSRIAKDFEEHGGAALVGQVANTHEDLAVLAQVLRDPRFETFRIFFTKQSKIVGQTGITSRAPGMVSIVTELPGETADQSLSRVTDDLTRQKKALGADGFWLLHNHPSGRATPSTADQRLTTAIANRMDGFQGHVVIDHDEYSHIKADGVFSLHDKEFTHKWDRDIAEIPHNALNRDVSSPGAVADVGKMIQRKDGFFTLIGRGADGTVASIAEAPISLLSKGGVEQMRLTVTLKRFATQTGSTNIIAVADVEGMRALRPLVKKGLLLDVVDISSRSPHGRLEFTSAREETNPDYDAKGLFGNAKSIRVEVGDSVYGKNTTLPEETKLEAARRIGQDMMIRFKRIQEWLSEQGVSLSESANVYQRENLGKAQTANAIKDFRDFEEAPLIKRIAEAGHTIEDITDYLEAVHIPEANERMRLIHDDPKATANGISDAEAKKVADEFELLPDFAEFKKLADEVQNIGTETLRMRVEAGLLSQERADSYSGAYKHWVPLRGDMAKQGFGKGMNVKVTSKRRFGHGVRNEYIFENLVMDRERAIHEIEKNKLAKTVAHFLMEANNPDIGTIGTPEKQSVIKDFTYAVTYNGRVISAFETQWQAQNFIVKTLSNGTGSMQGLSLSASDFAVSKTFDPHVAMMVKSMSAENEIQFYAKGYSVRMQLNDPLLARAATNAGIERLVGVLFAMREFNNFLSKAYTAWSPDFLLSNPARDLYQGLPVITGKMGAGFTGKALKKYSWAWKELWSSHKDSRKSEWVTRYRKAGGNTGAAYMSDIERIGSDAIKSMQEYMTAKEVYQTVYDAQKEKGASDSKAKTIATLKVGASRLKHVPVLGHFLDVMELTNGVFENTLRLAVFRTAIESGQTEQQAAQLAKDLMNFNRKGEISSEMGALYLFFNPSIQGMHVTVEALTSSPNKNQARMITGGMVMAAFMLAEMGRGGDDDDERKWRSIPANVKDRNLVIKIGDHQVTIPVAYGFGLFHMMGNAVSDVLHGVDSQKVSLNMASGLFENFSPISNPMVSDNGSTTIRPDQLLPTLPKMLIAPATNLNSFGSTIAPKKYRESLPDSENMSRSLRGTAYSDIAELLNSLSGGNPHQAGIVDVSPNVLKFWVTSLTGGAGRFAGDMFNAGVGATDGTFPDLNNIPVARRFLRESDVADTRTLFWESASKAKIAAEQFRDALKAGDKIPEDSARKFSRYANHAADMAGAKRNEIERVKNSNLQAGVKKSKIRQIEKAEQDIYNKFLESFERGQR